MDSVWYVVFSIPNSESELPKWSNVEDKFTRENHQTVTKAHNFDIPHFKYIRIFILLESRGRPTAERIVAAWGEGSGGGSVISER